MSDKFFLDTNVLVYLYSGDEPDKQTIARQLADQSNAWISTQVMNELANVLHRKFRQSYTVIAQVFDEIQTAVHVQTVIVDDLLRALFIAERYQYSYYDSLIIATGVALLVLPRNIITSSFSRGVSHNLTHTLPASSCFCRCSACARRSCSLRVESRLGII